MAKKETAITKYHKLINKHKKRMINDEKHIRRLKKTKNPSKKQKRSLRSWQRAYRRNKNALTKAKANYALAKKRSKEATHRRTIISKIKGDKRFKTHGYIMPNYPRTNSSFVFLYLTSESESHTTTVATQPVDHGVNITTTTQMSAPTIALEAIVGRKGDTMRTLKSELKKLKRWSDHGTDLRWRSNQGYVSHVVLSSISINGDLSGSAVNSYGIGSVGVSITLTKTVYANSNVKKKSSKTNSTGAKGAKKSSHGGKGKPKTGYVIAKRGFTYSYLAAKLGCKISTLEKLNKYPARKIPIGAKIYYPKK